MRDKKKRTKTTPPNSGTEPKKRPLPADGTDAIPVPESGFGKRLAELRAGKNLNHDALSELTKLADAQKRGIARTTLRGYELGVYKPGIRELRVLCQALGVSPNKLIFGEDTNEFTAPPLGAVTARDPAFAGHVFRREIIHQWIGFLVDVFNLDDHGRESVFRVAGDLTEAKLGSVEYRRLMGVTREIVDTVIDAQLDFQPGDRMKVYEKLLDRLSPIINAIGVKFGYRPPAPPK